MKPPNHGRRVRIQASYWLSTWTGRLVYIPESRRHPYEERTGLGIVVDEGAAFGATVCVLRGDRIELLP